MEVLQFRRCRVSTCPCRFWPPVLRVPGDSFHLRKFRLISWWTADFGVVRWWPRCQDVLWTTSSRFIVCVLVPRWTPLIREAFPLSLLPSGPVNELETSLQLYALAFICQELSFFDLVGLEPELLFCNLSPWLFDDASFAGDFLKETLWFFWTCFLMIGFLGLLTGRFLTPPGWSLS